MKKLSYATLKEQNYDGHLLEDAPERVLQFGEGNFLRAFVDYFIDVLKLVLILKLFYASQSLLVLLI